MGAAEAEIRMVAATYENTKGRVVVGSGMSNEFQINIGLILVRALIPVNLRGGNKQQKEG